MADCLTLHLRQKTMDADWAMADFYGPLIAGLQERGIRVQSVPLDSALTPDRVAADTGFHLVHAGRVRHPRVLNSAKAYLPGYYSIDPWGYRMFSATAALPFPGPTDVPVDQTVLQTLQDRTITHRRSLHRQPAAASEVPAGVIAVFLQAEDDREVGEKCHLTYREMIRALRRRDDPRPIWIKPHPKDRNLESYEFLGRQMHRDRRVALYHGNIHDLLAQAAVVVTINSAVGIEALVHEKPVILCGDCDFHHICETVRSSDQMDAAIARAELRMHKGDWPFAAYLSWFFGQIAVDGRAPDRVDQVLRRVSAHGYDIRRLTS
jgi:hypothetical protein